MGQRKQESKSIFFEQEVKGEIVLLFSDYGKAIHEILDGYYRVIHGKCDKTVIYDVVQSQVEKVVKNDEYIQKLESLVNSLDDDIMHLVRECLPKLSEHDYHYVCLSIAGFTTKEMSLLLGDTLDNLYVKKNRIKKVLNDLNSPSAGMLKERLRIYDNKINP